MGDMLSQAEIDALLNGGSSSDSDVTETDDGSNLSSHEIDALGEVGNISMGTSATTLFTLLGQKVLITTPKVTITSLEEMSKQYGSQFVAVRVQYTEGIIGTNLLIMKEEDVKVITDLMMGGEGSNTTGELTDLHLSAISEAMNQMVGSAATSMSSMFGKRIDISPPNAFIMQFDLAQPYAEFDASEKLVKVAFKMEVGNLIDSEIMQLIPIKFAKDLVDNLINVESASPAPQTIPVQQGGNYQDTHNMQQQMPMQQQGGGYYQQPQQYAQPQMPPQQGYGMGYVEQPPMYNEPPRNRPPVNVQPVQFQAFDDSRISIEKKNISLIMDVPLQVTVELGRTQRMIKDILEFGPGSVIELDKLAGEPVDILVNGKVIAKGEVVVIDESFGVRIIDIIHPSKRL